MRAHLVIALFSLVACSSEDRGDGHKSTFAGTPGGPEAFGNNGSGPSFGENAGSGPSFGENAGSGPSFGETSSEGATDDPTRACSTASPCAAPAECSESKSVGFCFVRCRLTGSADTEVGVCPGGLVCVRVSSTSSSGICLHTCTAAADCPKLSGLDVSCEPVRSSRICVWNGPPTTSTTPTSPGG